MLILWSGTHCHSTLALSCIPSLSFDFSVIKVLSPTVGLSVWCKVDFICGVGSGSSPTVGVITLY